MACECEFNEQILEMMSLALVFSQIVVGKATDNALEQSICGIQGEIDQVGSSCLHKNGLA